MTPFSSLAQLPLPEIERRVRQEIGAGETVLWAGRPAPGRLLRRAGATLGGGVFYVAVGLVCVFDAAREGAWLFIPVVLIGGVGLGSLLSWQSLRAVGTGRGTACCVTNRRVFILTPDGTAQSLSPALASARQVKTGHP